MGVLDYSGGYVIHLSSGTAAFVGAWWIGPRLQSERKNFQPNNILFAVVGAGILWIGWNGFNGGVRLYSSHQLSRNANLLARIRTRLPPTLVSLSSTPTSAPLSHS